MPIACVIGNLGAGKTLFLTHEVIGYYQKGYEIYTNYNIKHVPHDRIRKRKDIIKTGRATEEPKFYALDEGYLLFDAMERSSKIQKEYRAIINISRKMNGVIYFTSQSLGQINLRTRILLNYIIRPYYYKKQDILKIDYEYPSSVFMAGWEKLETRYIKKASRFFKYYDTNEIINDFIDEFLNEDGEED